MDWKSKSKAARERVAFLTDQVLKFTERAVAADLLATEMEKYNLFTDGPGVLLSPKNAEQAALKEYRRTAKEVEVALEQLR